MAKKWGARIEKIKIKQTVVYEWEDSTNYMHIEIEEGDTVEKYINILKKKKAEAILTKNILVKTKKILQAENKIADAILSSEVKESEEVDYSKFTNTELLEMRDQLEAAIKQELQFNKTNAKKTKKSRRVEKKEQQDDTDTCKSTFNERILYWEQLLTKAPSNEPFKQFTCKFCEKDFAKKSHILNHLVARDMQFLKRIFSK